tara:strand:- start:162 stop:470 length:309 start_codon:yes stop_codon:yes gene_type:complete
MATGINRYSATQQHKNDKLKTTRYPKFPKKMTDKYIISREMDRLDLLANEFYNDARYWWIIATANPELPKGGFIIPPGIQIRIPDVILPLLGNELGAVEKDR